MKKSVTMLLVFIIALSPIGQAFAAIPGYAGPTKPIKVFVHSKEVKLALPILTDVKAGRTLYPFRELLEYIGAEVSYETDARTAVAVLDGTTVKFPLDSTTYYVQDEAKKMDTKAMLDASAGKTYIPIRYAVEALGFDVMYIQCRDHDQIRISKLGDYAPISDEEFLEKYYQFDYTSVSYYKLDGANKRLIFNDDWATPPYKDLVPETKLNPDINRQLYELTKVLTSDRDYTYLQYASEFSNLPSSILFKYAFSQENALVDFNYFDFVFFENKPFDAKKGWNTSKFSDSAFLQFNLGKLWDKFNGSWSDQYYEKKLRDSMIALFGKNNGVDIYKYLFEYYIKVKNAPDDVYSKARESKTFGNIKVDFCMDNSALLMFYFSYVR